MITVINRIAWVASLTLSILIAFIISDIDSGSYTSGAENFFEWGWIFAIIALFFIKGKILSEKMIRDEFSSQEGQVSSTAYKKNESKKDEELLSGVIAYAKQNTATTTTIIPDEYIDETPEETVREEAPYVPPKRVVPPKPKEPNWIVVFFSDRPLAKIGGILLFLGALFFLSLVWNAIGSVGKILVGLIFGFTLYGIGVWMDKKGHTTESRTLLGVGIAINTLTILSGRWIIGDAQENILSDTVTLIFLLLNTLFAIVTALVYSSRTFLIFSFVFAYLIPFLTGAETDGIFLLLAYILIVSFGGYVLAYTLSGRSGQADDAKWLSHTVAIGSLFLMVITSWNIRGSGDLLMYVIAVTLLVASGGFLSRISSAKGNIEAIVISGYVMLMSALFGFGNQEGSIFIYIAGLIPVMIITGLQIVVAGGTALISGIFLFPLVFALFLLGIFGVTALSSIIIPILSLYALFGFFLFGYFTRFFQYVFFIALSVFLGICGLALDFHPIDLYSSDRLILSFATLILFILSLASVLRYKIFHLSFIGLFTSMLLFVILLVPSWNLSWIFYGVFLFIAFIAPFVIESSLVIASPVTLIAYQIFLNIFMIGELFFLGSDVWFTGTTNTLITLGIIVFVISSLSLFYSFSLMRKMTGASLESMKDLPVSQKNTISTLFAIPLSLFSLAVAVTFSENALIVATVWILESTILAYFYGKNKNKFVITGSLILLAIGLIRITGFFDTIHARDWLSLVPLSIIGVSLFLGVRSILERDDTLAYIYDILHVLGMGALAVAFMQIIPHSTTGWSLVGISLILAVSLYWYKGIKSVVLSLWLVALSAFYFFYHLVRVESLSLDFFPILIQLFALGTAFFSAFSFSRRDGYGRLAFTWGSIATLLITSLYINEITDNVFFVTIYLTFVSTFFLLRGINQDRPSFRTVGLYIGVFVLVKILFYDLWIGVDNLVIRVLALMISGGVMIALSQLYGKSMKRSWSEEFSWMNFAPSSGVSQGDSKVYEKNDGDEGDTYVPFTDDIAASLKSIDISDTSSVKFIGTNGDSIFETKRVGILRISLFIVEKLGKDRFAPNELSSVFGQVLPHVRSTLPKNQLDTILEKLGTWIAEGGVVEFIQK